MINELLFFLAEVIKNVCDLKLKVVTQCVRARNVERVNRSTLDNILLKINAKVGGINNTSLGYQINPQFNFQGVS